MPAKFDLKLSDPKEQLLTLGTQLKQHRRAHKWSAEAVASAAGLSRTTLHRIEAGEPSVAAGAYWAVVYALGLNCGLIDKPVAVLNTLPDSIELAIYPELKLLAWHVQGVQFISPREKSISQFNKKRLQESTDQTAGEARVAGKVPCCHENA